MNSNNIIYIVLLFCLLFSFSYSTYNGNYALSFDGVDDLILVQHSYEDDGLDDLWTLEAWINPVLSQSSHQLNIVGYPGRHPNLEFCGDNNWQCNKSSPLTQLREANGQYYTIVGDPNKITPDTWHHICGTWDNVTLNLYVDGQLDATVKPYDFNYTDARGCFDYDCDSGLQIGGFKLRTQYGYFSSQYFRGMIDEVRVWNIGRSQAEIVSTMSKALTGGEPGLQYYWRFDEGSGTTVKSLAMDGYGLLGGGLLTAQPRFIPSTAPITADPNDLPNKDTIVIERNSPGAVAAGAVVAVFFLFGGISIGGLVGWKLHEKRHTLRTALEVDKAMRRSFASGAQGGNESKEGERGESGGEKEERGGGFGGFVNESSKESKGKERVRERGKEKGKELVNVGEEEDEGEFREDANLLS